MTDAAEPVDAAWWRDGRARPLVAVGLLLVASGLAHVAVWGLLGGPWEGPVTWRKPILFGISGGLTSLSLGWAFATRPWLRFDLALAWGTALALAVEVAAIDVQRYRGVASHFNRQTPLDSFLYDALGGLILFVSLVAADLTVRSFLPPARLAADMLLAQRAGLVFLVVSCGLGIWASVHGDLRAAAGLAPETLGAAGGVEAILCVLALQHQIIPPTINLDAPDDACDLDYVPHRARPHTLHAVMSNSFGFGGHNASIVLRRAE